MPAISVVINTYNSAKFICETIQSVLDQSWTDFELIIIDDGSKDNTLEVVKTIQDDRILIYPYTNGGISKSRNRGIERASGE
ncbi:MAG: glycosyltransferase family A protein, partial [Cyanobacteria bacterium]|nr:glycosyltransferase family A protein [Cyanobacteriota bacterium]